MSNSKLSTDGTVKIIGNTLRKEKRKPQKEKKKEIRKRRKMQKKKKKGRLNWIKR
jgi:hypothetical protein